MSSDGERDVAPAVDAAVAAFAAALSTLTTHAHETGSAVVPAETRIDRIALLERLRAVVAAAQNAEMLAYARDRVEQHLAQVDADRLDPAAVGRGIADEIALACHTSPHHGSRRLATARALDTDLPATAVLLAAGQISEHIAAVVVSETGHLDADQRRTVDKQIAGSGLTDLSPRAATALVKKCAYEADHAAYVRRGRTARADRRVGLRPAPDTMSVLTGFLPVEQGVACLAALRAHTDTVIATGGDGRTRDQIMADALVQRLTGQATATDVNVEVGIVLPLTALVDPDQGGTAEVVGAGPVPAGTARDLLASTAGNRRWRRLFTSSEGGPLVGSDPRRRRCSATPRSATSTTSGPTAPAGRPVWPTGAGSAPAATTSGRCPAGRSKSSTRVWASDRTRCGPPPRPDTPTSARPGRRPDLPELPCPHGLDEPSPGRGGALQRRAGAVLGVADEGVVGQVGHLDALADAVGEGRGPPGRPRRIDHRRPSMMSVIIAAVPASSRHTSSKRPKASV